MQRETLPDVPSDWRNRQTPTVLVVDDTPDNLALMAELLATATALFAGTVVVTVGRLVSGADPVVKLQATLAASALPARSAAAVVTVAVNALLAGRLAGVAGVKTTVRPLAA